MPTFDKRTRQKLNVEFDRRLQTGDPPVQSIIVETKPGKAQQVAREIQQIPDAKLDSAGVIAGDFVSVEVPEEMIPQVARISGVELIHQDQLVSIQLDLESTPQLIGGSPKNRPIQQFVSKQVMSAFYAEDPYVGRVGISEVEVPVVPLGQLPPGNPIQTLIAASDHFALTNFTGEEYVPTSQSVSWFYDGDLLGDEDGSGTRLAVIDTGHTPIEPSNNGRTPTLRSHVPGEGPLDLMSHGSWCTNTAVGGTAPSSWGQVDGVASGAEYAHMKALNTFPGFGRTSWILSAMQDAVDWGADVISMSLGGTQQGPVTQDPYSRFIRSRCKEVAGDDEGAIFVVAAGNSGPSKYQIGSPGVAPKALTVGAWSMKDKAPSFYSSRGPQGSWYANNQDKMREDMSSVGGFEFVKPDVVAPGGGRETQEKDDEEGELLHQAATGWAEGMHDGLKDARGMMKGTSMSTPHVAGFVDLLYNAGIVSTAREVKQVMRERGTVREYASAAENANVVVDNKNVAVGFGPISESVFTPES